MGVECGCETLSHGSKGIVGWFLDSEEGKKRKS